MTTMDVLIAIVLNLVSALLGFWIGWFWQFLKRMLQYRRARDFWKPFIAGDLQVVVGRFFNFASFEPSGFLGVGDAIGLTELRAYFVKLGLHDFTVSYADQLNGEDLNTNLILIGGPDANSISKKASERIPSKLRFGDPAQHVVAIFDSSTERRGLRGDQLRQHYFQAVAQTRDDSERRGLRGLRGDQLRLRRNYQGIESIRARQTVTSYCWQFRFWNLGWPTIFDVKKVFKKRHKDEKQIHGMLDRSRRCAKDSSGHKASPLARNRAGESPGITHLNFWSTKGL